VADSPLRLRDGRLPQPDLMVLRGGFEVHGRRLAEPADVLLLIEVADDPDSERGVYRSRAVHQVGSTVAILGIEIPVDDVYRFLPA